MCRYLPLMYHVPASCLGKNIQFFPKIFKEIEWKTSGSPTLLAQQGVLKMAADPYASLVLVLGRRRSTLVLSISIRSLCISLVFVSNLFCPFLLLLHQITKMNRRREIRQPNLTYVTIDRTTRKNHSK